MIKLFIGNILLISAGDYLASNYMWNNCCVIVKKHN